MNHTDQKSSTSAEALHAQGLELARHRRFEEAIDRFEKALAADPNRMEVLGDLARANSDAGRWPSAEEHWEKYTTRCPKSADGFRSLGHVRRRNDKHELALAAFTKASQLEAGSVPILLDLAATLAHFPTKKKEAKEVLLKAIELDNNSFDAHTNLGMVLQELSERADALKHLRRAIELRPDDPVGHNNLGVALSEQEQFCDAVTAFQLSLQKDPKYFLAWNNLGNALRSQGKLDDAEQALRKALEIRPDYTEAHNNLGIIFTQKEQCDNAIQEFDRALLLRPEYAEAHANRGLVHLLMGDFRRGWADYEWRWHGKQGMKRREYPGKAWDGSPLSGKRILLHYEQGLGDTFQFIRYAKELKARGATVLFECQPPMRQILSRTPGIDEFVNRGDRLPRYDFYAPLLSLPGLCQTNLDNLPRRVPYLFPDPTLVWQWKQRIAGLRGFKVGIVWQGNPGHKGDKNRSIPLKCFAPIAQIPGVTLVNLQKNTGVEQIEQLANLFKLTDFAGVAEEDDGWLRTAAIMANLDLMICADTSVAHVAGAMGLPVWVAIQKSPDWRWLLNRMDTPWYPTMRLFRQQTIREWDGVFAEIASALVEHLNLQAAISVSLTKEQAHSIPKLFRQASEALANKQFADAQSTLQQIIERDPANADAHQDLGVVLARQGQVSQALACFRRALELSPDSPGLYGNIGLACYHMNQIDDAVSHLRKAVWLGAGSADTYKNLGRALSALPDPAGAEECYWSALRLAPDDAECHHLLSQAQLMQGKFEQGWLEHEWRWKWRDETRPTLPSPRWVGESLQGKRIVMIAEADPRDTIQYCRYAATMASMGAHVGIQCTCDLAPLLEGCLGIEHVFTFGKPVPPHDYHITIQSIPRAMGTSLNTIPASRPYIGVPTAKLELWRRWLAESGSPTIGLALSSGSAMPGQPGARLDLTLMAEQLAGRHARIAIHLQPGKSPSPTGAESISHPPEMPDEPAERWVAFAALLRNLKLLITVDNTLAHLAGAMGVPTWVILPVAPEPRWMLHTNESPWYPTMRLFRQRIRHDWRDVIDRVRSSLDDRSGLKF